MILSFVMIVLGLIILVWSAYRFVDGATGIAHIEKMPPLPIGMLIVGFGMSAPELTVSAFAAIQGNLQLELGKAYSSNITNIALILGNVALIQLSCIPK